MVELHDLRRWTVRGAVVVSGYFSTVGNGGRPTVDSGGSGAGFGAQAWWKLHLHIHINAYRRKQDGFWSSIMYCNPLPSEVCHACSYALHYMTSIRL